MKKNISEKAKRLLHHNSLKAWNNIWANKISIFSLLDNVGKSSAAENIGLKMTHESEQWFIEPDLLGGGAWQWKTAYVHVFSRRLHAGHGSMTAFIPGDTRHQSAPIINPGWAPAQVAALVGGGGYVPVFLADAASIGSTWTRSCTQTSDAVVHIRQENETSRRTNQSEEFCCSSLTEYYSCPWSANASVVRSIVVRQDLLQRSTRAQHSR